jgi:hypothetical protein
MSFRIVIACLFVCTALSGCADSEPKVCDPGKTDVCLCIGGGQGVQSCSNDGTGWGKCECGVAPQPDTTSQLDIVSGDTEACVPSDPYVSKGCYENSVFWFDSCDEKGELIETCQVPEETCTAGECVTGCAPNHHKGCEGNSVWWFDSCNNKGELIETCAENTTCGNGECQESCEIHAYKACKGNDVYWYDSCGVEETLAELCETDDFCVEDKCIKPSFAGTWYVEAKPANNGLGTFQPFTGPLTYVDGVATLTEPGFADSIEYVGDINGKVMKLNGTYEDLAGTVYNTVITVTFDISESLGAKVPPDFFKGVYIQEIGGFGQTSWNIEGVKQ